MRAKCSCGDSCSGGDSTLDGSGETVVADLLTVAGGPQVAVAAFQRILLTEPSIPGTASSLMAVGETVALGPGVVEIGAIRSLN